MASVFQEKSGGKTRYRIQFIDAEGRRRKLRIAGVNKCDATAIAKKIAAIVSCRISREPLPPSLAEWLREIGGELRDKLVAVGLASAKPTATLGDSIQAYIGSRQDAATSTIVNLRHAQTRLCGHFGSDCDWRSISEGDADAWRQSLINSGLAQATVSKIMKRAKQFAVSAVRNGYCDSNPFSHLKAGREHNPERQFTVTRDAIAQVLDAAPNAEWRAIIVLSRFAGLRCPTETLALRWDDIDWHRQRMRVTSTKTKRYHKGSRTLPLFPEVAFALREAQEAAPDGSEYVVSRHRGNDTNLRTQFQRILRRAGIEPWPRLFHNMRASCQTDLAQHFPAHVVCEWIGNTEAVARKHYFAVTETDFTRAVAPETWAMLGAAQGVGRGVGQSIAVTDGNEKKALPHPMVVSSANHAFADIMYNCQAPPVGLEPTTWRLTAARSTS